MFLLRKRFWINVLKVAALAYVAGLILLQAPELRYDLGPHRPLPISGLDGLKSRHFGRATFVSIAGTPEFRYGFKYPRYGLTMTFFNVQGYDLFVVARTFEEVDDDWSRINHLVGRLTHFDRSPFARRVRQAYQGQFGVTVPKGAYLLAMDDVPRVGGWQVAAVLVALAAWAAMFWTFFLRKRRPVSPESSGPQ